MFSVSSLTFRHAVKRNFMCLRGSLQPRFPTLLGFHVCLFGIGKFISSAVELLLEQRNSCGASIQCFMDRGQLLRPHVCTLIRLRDLGPPQI
ncbi:hypothetical protein WL99_01785 [Burkholderia cepacia]|nr:hypothetical protein WL99_01785 [Burkholderia cepacia]